MAASAFDLKNCVDGMMPCWPPASRGFVTVHVGGKEPMLAHHSEPVQPSDVQVDYITEKEGGRGRRQQTRRKAPRPRAHLHDADGAHVVVGRAAGLLVLLARVLRRPRRRGLVEEAAATAAPPCDEAGCRHVRFDRRRLGVDEVLHGFQKDIGGRVGDELSRKACRSKIKRGVRQPRRTALHDMQHAL